MPTTRAMFIGSKSLGLKVFQSLHQNAEGLEWCIAHPEDSGDSRSCLRDWQHAATSREVELRVVANSDALDNFIAEKRPEVAIVCGWYRLLKDETIRRIGLGMWGIHNSLLPMYRGGSPLVWSIIRGDEFVGSTVFRISTGLDDGPILLQIRLRNHPELAVGNFLNQIETQLCAEFPKYLAQVIKGTAYLGLQNEHLATFCGQRIPSDGQIDWSQDAKRVHDFVRAQSEPYSGAFTFLAGQKVTVMRARPFPKPCIGTPGQIVRRLGDSTLVACGSSSGMIVDEIDVGDGVVAAGSFLNSVSFRLT